SAEKSLMVSYFFCSACASSAGVWSAANTTEARTSAHTRSMDSTIADVSRERREDVRSICRANGSAGVIERDEADTSFYDQRVLPVCDDVTESHPPNCVGREPRLHSDLHVHPIDFDVAIERPA